MAPPPSDEELASRQADLHAEAADMLADLDLAAIVADVGPMLFTGSYVSHLMCRPEVDVMVHVGADFSPQDVLNLLQRMVAHPGLTGFDSASSECHSCRPPPVGWKSGDPLAVVHNSRGYPQIHWRGPESSVPVRKLETGGRRPPGVNEAPACSAGPPPASGRPT
jgi:hypothetical protein